MGLVSTDTLGGCKLTLVMVQAVVGGQDALQEGSRLGAGAGGVHAEQRLCCHLPAVPLLLLAGIHCNNPHDSPCINLRQKPLLNPHSAKPHTHNLHLTLCVCMCDDSVIAVHVVSRVPTL